MTNRYKPALKTLGWHIGLWNLVGGIGFTLCPAVGFGSESSAALEYASALSTFVGSWAFLVGRRPPSFLLERRGRWLTLLRSVQLPSGTNLWTSTPSQWKNLLLGFSPARRQFEQVANNREGKLSQESGGGWFVSTLPWSQLHLSLQLTQEVLLLSKPLGFSSSH
jgi:hypothetical protein